MQLPMSLLCNITLSNVEMKPSRLQKYLQKVHHHKQNRNLLFFTNMNDKFLKIFQSSYSYKSLIASHIISKLIAKSGKALTIGEE